MSGDPYYKTSEWKALRAAVLKRDPICRMPGCTARSTIPDHIVPRRRGGADTMSNLRGVCHACHNRITAHGQAMRPKGCDAQGWPIDPDHAWNRDGEAS